MNSNTITMATQHNHRQKHRILLYTTCYNVLDGVTLTIRKIERELLKAGHHILILTSDSGDRNNTHLDGSHPHRQVLFLDNSTPIFFLHDFHNPNQLYHAGFRLSRKTRKLLDEFRPTLVHVTCPDVVCLNLIQYARQREVPLMGTYHSNISEYMDHYDNMGWAKHILAAFFRHQYNFLQRLYVPTRFIQDFLSESYQMDKVTSLQVWGRGIDLAKFSPTYRSTMFRQKLGIDDNTVVVCFVGRLVVEKRLDIFAEVVRRLSSSNEEEVSFHALIVGSGPMEEQLRGLPNTTLCGWLSGNDLSTAYASSDVFLFPSAVETFGNVTLEAAASGLPLVVEKNCSGHLVQHGVNGYACEARDVDAFYDATLRLVRNKDDRMLFSKASRQHSLLYQEQAVMKQMLENYQEVTDEFYCDYGGRHENRDRQYWKEGSFRAGNRPRPLLLLCVERLLEMILVAMWHLTLLFFCFRERMLESTVRPLDASQSARQSSSRCRQQQSTRDSKATTSVPLEDSSDDESVDLQSLAPTECSSDCSMVSSSPLDSSATAPTDYQLSHALARGFVKIVENQCLVESYIRNAVGHCISAPILFSKHERKNSNVLLEDDQRHFDESSSSSGLFDTALVVDAERGRQTSVARRSPSRGSLTK